MSPVTVDQVATNGEDDTFEQSKHTPSALTFWANNWSLLDGHSEVIGVGFRADQPVPGGGGQIDEPPSPHHRLSNFPEYLCLDFQGLPN